MAAHRLVAILEADGSVPFGFGRVGDLVAAFADTESVSVDDRVHDCSAVGESCCESGLVFALARFSLAPGEVGDPPLLLFLACRLVAFGSLFERARGVAAEEAVVGELLSVAAERWALAVAAREVFHACSLSAAVDVDQPCDRLGVRPGRRHGFGCGLGFERVVVELAGECGERVLLEIVHRLARVEQEGERGRGRLAELGEMFAVELQALLLQMGAARVRVGTEPLPLRVACALFGFSLARVAS